MSLCDHRRSEFRKRNSLFRNNKNKSLRHRDAKLWKEENEVSGISCVVNMESRSMHPPVRAEPDGYERNRKHNEKQGHRGPAVMKSAKKRI